MGDFDFRDPTKPEERNGGKLPKFAFGLKPNVKSSNVDTPGPGEYNTDKYPMSQKNISYFIGNEVRRDAGIPFSHLYPGPGQYDIGLPNEGPFIS